MSTTRTSKKDCNYLSLNRDSVVWFAGTDNERPGSISDPADIFPENPKDWDAILKCSGRENTHLTDLRVSQGRENSLDLNNKTAFCSFSGEWGCTGDDGDQVFTVKGASHDIKISGKIYSKGKKADVVVGCWSDQSFYTSHTLDFSDLKRFDGKPVTLIFGRVNSPLSAALGKPKYIVLPANSKVLFWASLAEISYWWIKWSFVKTGLIRLIKI